MPSTQLFIRITTTGSPCITPVAISFIFMWKLPSPVNSTVLPLPTATDAPFAAPTPNPIVPRPPEVRNVRGFSKS
jgi:hypothetical protein